MPSPSFFNYGKNMRKWILVLAMVFGLVLPAIAQETQVLATLSAFEEYQVASYANGCPDGFPLLCPNNRCCPAGATMWCGGQARPCFNPDLKTDEELRWYAQNCKPLYKCN